MKLPKIFLTLAIVAGLGFSARAQAVYRKPPAEIARLLETPSLPLVFPSPDGRRLLLAQPINYPPISDLARPLLQLAGVRIDPKTNGLRSSYFYYTKFTIKQVASGKEAEVVLPLSSPRLGRPLWNADGSMFAFAHEAEAGIELWVADAATGRAAPVKDIRLNPVLGDEMQWLPDQRTLLVKMVPQKRGDPPPVPRAPVGPRVLESSGVAAASSTYEARDLLKTPYDADLFDYYATSQPARIEAASGKIHYVGSPAVYGGIQPSPDGRYLLVERYHRPYSYQRAYWRFPCEVELWTAEGVCRETLASQPLSEEVPIDGEVPGPREHRWQATAPATIVWIEALDGGDPGNKVSHRDRLMARTVDGQAYELCRTEHRLTDIKWIADTSLYLVSEYDRDRRWVRESIYDAARPQDAPRVLRDHNLHEKYLKPGSPVRKMLANGARAVQRDGHWIYLAGEGFLPDNQRPFLDRLNLNTLETERLWRSEPDVFEQFIAWHDPARGEFITRRESTLRPPNYFLRKLGQRRHLKPSSGEAGWRSSSQAITGFNDPQPSLRRVRKQVVTYQRADGLPLAFTLYLPPGYKKGQRLPAVLWAYPGDISTREAAAQVSASPHRFVLSHGADVQLLALAGYAVLDDVSMPVVGPPASSYDDFVEQLVLNAQAAVDKAAQMGVIDPDRVAIGGHSHGGLMTATLLAWSDIFRAGLAHSGAYNHTLRPFGFQNERRTYWQAREAYIKNSPTLQADWINEPLLLIHGEVDQNPGTVPLQSEKLYEAVRGCGGTVRLVMLPHEGHGYQARESVETVLAEWVDWLDKYVKNAGPRNGN